MRIKRLFKSVYEFFHSRYRLRKIERATNVRLTKRQRKAVLSANAPCFLGWGDKSGKTLTACFWTLLWRKDPIRIREERMKLRSNQYSSHGIKASYAIPDPDGYYHSKRLANLIETYIKYDSLCNEYGIKTCKVIFPSQLDKGRWEYIWVK